MTMAAERRNELDRAKHTKAIRSTLYELGILIGGLNVFDRLAGIWPKFAGCSLSHVAVVIGLILVSFMVFMRVKGGKSLALLEEQLGKDEIQRDDGDD